VAQAKNSAEIVVLEEKVLEAINVTSTEALLEESEVFNMLVALQVRGGWGAGRACALTWLCAAERGGSRPEIETRLHHSKCEGFQLAATCDQLRRHL